MFCSFTSNEQRYKNAAEGDRRSSEGRVDLGIRYYGIIQWQIKEDDDKKNDKQDDDNVYQL